MKGYKVFNPDWKCRDFQYAVGEEYVIDGEPTICKRGFHFCTDLNDCFSYYNFNSDNKVAEIEALGYVDEEDNDTKCCTNKIKIVRALTWEEVLQLVNTGKCNSGRMNSGNRNSGNYNSGDCNSGNYNSGDYNSGYWNKTDYSSGCFNTEEQFVPMFNKPTDMTLREWRNSDAYYLLNEIEKLNTKWIVVEDMTDEEKENFPDHKTTGGYLKKLDESEKPQIWWDKLSKSNKQIIKAIPNFDQKIFEEITGIDMGE